MQPYLTGTVDFCFKNTRSYPIKIISTVKNGVATIEIYGMKEEKEYEVVIESTVTEVIPYEVTYVQDDSMQEGEEEIKQYGCNGAKSETYKILKYNGMVVSKTLISKDTYSALERIIKTGKKQTKQTNGEIEDGGIVINKEEFKNLNPELLESIKELE